MFANTKLRVAFSKLAFLQWVIKLRGKKKPSVLNILWFVFAFCCFNSVQKYVTFLQALRLSLKNSPTLCNTQDSEIGHK